MKILLYGINFRPELTGIGKYSGELFDYLTEKGWEVDALTAVPYYPEWKVSHGFKNRYSTETTGNGRVTRCPLYLPRELNTFKRAVHLLSFALTSLPIFIFRLIQNRYDIVLCVEPTKAIAPQILVLCWLFRIKTWLHMQDFEFDALRALTGDQTNSVFQRIDKILTNGFAHHSTISAGMVKHAKKSKHLEDIVLFPNWVDTDFLSPEGPRDFFLELGYAQEDRIILYSGNLGLKQGLDRIPLLAKHFLEHPSYKFVICGSGAMRRSLEETCAPLQNVDFLDLQPYEQLPRMLRSADVHLVLQQFDFSDLVMPSKLTSLLSCGCYSIVTAPIESELGRLATVHPGIFELVNPEDNEQLLEAIEKLAVTHESNQIARSYAEQFLSKDRVLEKFVEDLKTVTDIRK